MDEVSDKRDEDKGEMTNQSEDDKLEKEGLEEMPEDSFDSSEIEKEDQEGRDEEGSKEIKENQEVNNNFLKENKELEEIQNKQIKWSVFLMIAILLIIVAVPFVNTNFINKFDYNGIVFQKTRLGDLEFYSTKFPVVSGTGQVIGEYAINLRNDPRELDNIPVNVWDDKIEFATLRKSSGDRVYAPTYISLDPFMEACEDSGISLLTFSGFLKDSGLEVSSAVTNKSYAEENGLTYKKCESMETVIIIKSGNETAINQIEQDCYEILFKDCEILQASERFTLSVVEQYAGRFEESG